MRNYIPWRKKTPHFIPGQVSFAFPDAAVHWCHTLTEIQPDLYPLEVRWNPVLLLYGNHAFCHVVFTSAIRLSLRMLKWVPGFSEIHPFKPKASLLPVISVCEKRIRLSVYAVVSADFVSEPSREEVDILKIIPVGIFMLACEESEFGTMSKLLCHWISRIAIKFVPELVREALTNSRSDTFGVSFAVSFAVKLLSTSRAFCDGHHQISPLGHLLTLSPAILYWLALSQHGMTGQTAQGCPDCSSGSVHPMSLGWEAASSFCTQASVLSRLTQLLSLPYPSVLCLMSPIVLNLFMMKNSQC